MMERTLDSEISSLKNFNAEVISLSDSDTESESAESSASVEIIENRLIEIIDIDDSFKSNVNIENEVISINDSTASDEPQHLFKLDTLPDFIPVTFHKSRPAIRRGFCRKKYDTATRITTGKISSKKRKKNRQDDGVTGSTPNGNQPIYTPVIQLSYSNILNDNTEESKPAGPRPIIIDGCNVGHGYGNGTFVMHGIILVVQYFKKRGHEEIVCFLPQPYRHRVRSPSEERTVGALEKEAIFSFTPSRRLHNGKRITSYDDRYIVQYATERQGVIISNDGYRDLINEEPTWRETIENRIVNYTFARGLFMLPKDPLGPTGPTLDEILKFP